MSSFGKTFNGIETKKLIQTTSASTAIESDFKYKKANKLHTGILTNPNIISLVLVSFSSLGGIISKPAQTQLPW